MQLVPAVVRFDADARKAKGEGVMNNLIQISAGNHRITGKAGDVRACLVLLSHRHIVCWTTIP